MLTREKKLELLALLDEKQARADKVRASVDFEHFAHTRLHIRTKSGQLESFTLNKPQRYLHARLEEQRAKTGRVRALVLKARQQGASTYIGGRFYWKTSHTRGYQCFILTHEQPATDNLFKMVDRYYENDPHHPSTTAANAKELYFNALDSGYSVGTAGTKSVGRSKTIQLLHGSEVAFWPNAAGHFASVVQGVPDLEDTEIILESTANGIGGEFHERWQQAEAGVGDYQAIFIPWFWSEEYARKVPYGFVLNEEEAEYAALHELTLEQMVWRRAKLEELKDPQLFKQEFPACVAAGERVGTSRGLLPIEDVLIGDHTASGVVSDVMDNGERATIRLTTALGYKVICTPDHRISVGDEWVEAKDVLGRSVTLQPPLLSDELATVSWSPFPCVESKILIDEEFGRFLGYFMGDGCWHDGTLSVACDGGDVDVVADVTSLVTKIIGVPTARVIGSKKGCTEVRIGRKTFADVLNALGVIRDTNPHRKVCVPECIWRSPQPVVREFLRGLFEADGFCGYDGAKASLFSKHHGFLRDVQLLLLTLGITSKLTHQNKTNSQGRAYIGNALVLRVSETRRFLEKVGFVSSRKQGRLEGYIINHKGRPGAPILLEDRVVSIEDAGVRRVYDLTVPGKHHFDASGIRVHNCASEAFQTTGHDSFIGTEHIMSARKRDVEGVGPLILGVDPSRFGDDSFAMAWRKGREVDKIERRHKLDAVAGAHWIKQVIDDDAPERVFVDAGGIGGPVVDILHSWGPPYAKLVVAVDFGGSPTEPPRTGSDGRPLPGPLNRRAEMWRFSKDWLATEGGVSIPDDDALHADACAPGYRYNMNQKLVLESKEDIRKRGLRSPDGWDAVALTFAAPVKVRIEEPSRTRYAGSTRRRASAWAV